MRNFLRTLLTDILDFFFNDFSLYRRLSGDDWSLIQCRHCPRPFWLRGIPPPKHDFQLLQIQHASRILTPLHSPLVHPETTP